MMSYGNLASFRQKWGKREENVDDLSRISIHIITTLLERKNSQCISFLIYVIFGISKENELHMRCSKV